MLGKTSESDMSARLYDLIYELNLIAPSVLLAVLPQLDFKLKVRSPLHISHFIYFGYNAGFERCRKS